MPNRKRKKILFIVQLPPPIHGVGMVNSQLVNSEIITGNYELDIINFQFAKSLKGIAKISLMKLLKMVGYAFQIFRKVLFGRPDLVYFTIAPNGIAFYRDAFYVLIMKTLGAKIVYHLHGKGIKKLTEESGWKNWLYRMVFKHTHIVCLSQKLTADIRGVYDRKPFVVPNGLAFQNGALKKDPLDKNSVPRLFYLSNFFTTKGILVLLKALKKLKQSGHQFEAKFAGAPGDISLEFLNSKVEEEGLADRVEVLGPIYGEGKYAALRKADIFVHPTYNDAFPLVILEAMQCGLPVVSTHEGGIPNMVEHGETGFLVESKNAEKLEEKIAVLLEDENLRVSMGDNGYARFKNNFTMLEFEKNMDKVFKKIFGIKTDVEIPLGKKVNFDITSDQLN